MRRKPPAGNLFKQIFLLSAPQCGRHAVFSSNCILSIHLNTSKGKPARNNINKCIVREAFLVHHFTLILREIVTTWNTPAEISFCRSSGAISCFLLSRLLLRTRSQVKDILLEKCTLDEMWRALWYLWGGSSVRQWGILAQLSSCPATQAVVFKALDVIMFVTHAVRIKTCEGINCNFNQHLTLKINHFLKYGNCDATWSFCAALAFLTLFCFRYFQA